MSSFPWPTTGPVAASTSGEASQLPWIPPPPIYGLPMGHPPANATPGTPYFYHNDPSRATGPREAAARDYYAQVNARTGDGGMWPLPADLPFPSSFPMPPSVLPSPLPTRSFEYPPPPLSLLKGWRNPWGGAPPEPSASQAQASRLPTDETRRREPALVEIDVDVEDGTDNDDDEDTASSCSSCSECARQRASQGRPRSPVMPARRRVSRRPPVPAEHRSAPRNQPLPQPQRLNTEDHMEWRRRQASAPSPRGAPVVPRSRSRPASPSPSPSSSPSEVSERRLELAAERAERMLADIEALYQRLRANYEAIQHNPHSFSTRSTPLHVSTRSPPQAPRTAGVSDSSLTSPAPKMPTQARSTSAVTPPQPQRQIRLPPPPKDKTSSVAQTSAPPLGTHVPPAVPPREVPPAPVPSTRVVSMSSELQAQLLKLESQWKRLEEMKQSNHGGTAIPTSRVKSLPPPSQDSLTSSSSATAGGVSSIGGPTSTVDTSSASRAADMSALMHVAGGSAEGATTNPRPAFGTAQVLQLIRERKAMVGAA